jgi:uridine kinase
MTEKNLINITLMEPSSNRSKLPSIKEMTIEKGSTLQQLAVRLGSSPREPQSQIVAAYVNGKLSALNTEIHEYSRVQLLNLGVQEGRRTYQRTVLFMLCAACHQLMPKAKVIFEHSLSNGIYLEIHGVNLSGLDVFALKSAMKEMVDKKEPIDYVEMSKSEAIDLIGRTSPEDTSLLRLLGQMEKETVGLHRIKDFYDYLDGPTLPSCEQAMFFELHYYMPGIIVQTPEKIAPPSIPEYKEQRKLAEIYLEAEKWAKIMKVSDAATLNSLSPKEIGDLIRINEALHEKKIAQLADLIMENKEIRLITIAGPSSSGKTTFSQRLLIQLRVNGLHPYTLHLDDYFVSREQTPLDEDSNPDFESIKAIDLDLFNDQLCKLIQGDEVEVPTFDFTIGQRVYTGKKLKLPKDAPIIVEGIHGLNDLLTQSIPKSRKFKIYISALTQINIHDRVRIHTTDVRLIRRIVRDAQFRSHGADETLTLWPMVRKGEERNIFPFQEEADIMFNSALLYDLAVLKKPAEKLLNKVPETSLNRPKANQLLWILSHFKEIDPKEVPVNSILREFTGGSCFH